MHIVFEIFTEDIRKNETFEIESNTELISLKLETHFPSKQNN